MAVKKSSHKPEAVRSKLHDVDAPEPETPEAPVAKKSKEPEPPGRQLRTAAQSFSSFGSAGPGSAPFETVSTSWPDPLTSTVCSHCAERL